MKIAWQYYFARKWSLLRYDIVQRVFISSFYKKHFKVRLKNALVKPEDGKNYAIYIERHELADMQQRVFKVVCKNLRKFYYYKKIIKRTQVAWLKAAKMAAKEATPKITNQRLKKLYDIFIHHYQEHFNKPIWIIFPIEQLLAGEVEQALRNALTRAGRPHEFSHWLEVILTPEEVNAISRAQMETLRLAIAIKQKKLGQAGRGATLKLLVKKYGFIQCYDVIDAPWGEEHFAEEINNYLKRSLNALCEQLSEMEGRFKHAKINFKGFLREIPLKPREKELCVMAHELVFLKDERDDYRREGSYWGRIFMGEVGRRFGLSPRESAYLTVGELERGLTRGLSPALKRQARERLNGYTLLRKGNKSITVASGERMKKLLASEFFAENQEIGRDHLRGVVASGGKAKGRAVIVHTKHDLRRVFEGAIMISVTTNADYVPAMGKCSAIVTDEGGLTCHAAIVSREMRKPCIVGTKTGTKVFKEGETVEVDAERGLVRKL